MCAITLADLSVIPCVRQSGFTLLEVLVSVFILALGLLGFAQLQTLGLQANQHAYQQSQAALLARDIIDRMQANMQFETTVDVNGNNILGDLLQNYNDVTPAEHPECYQTEGCSSSDMAAHDLYEWEQSLRNVLGTSAIGKVCIDLKPETSDCDDPADPNFNTYAVRISWSTGEESFSYVVTFQPISTPVSP